MVGFRCEAKVGHLFWLSPVEKYVSADKAIASMWGKLFRRQCLLGNSGAPEALLNAPTLLNTPLASPYTSRLLITAFWDGDCMRLVLSLAHTVFGSRASSVFTAE
jgi:hypothetical protein